MGIMEKLGKKPADSAALAAHMAQHRDETSACAGELLEARERHAATERAIGVAHVAAELDGTDTTAEVRRLETERAGLLTTIERKTAAQRAAVAVGAELTRRHHAASVAEAQAEQQRLGKEYHALVDEVEKHLLAAAQAQARARALDDQEVTLRRSSLLARADGAPAPSLLQTPAGHERWLGPDLAGYAEGLARTAQGKIT